MFFKPDIGNDKGRFNARILCCFLPYLHKLFTTIHHLQEFYHP